MEASTDVAEEPEGLSTVGRIAAVAALALAMGAVAFLLLTGEAYQVKVRFQNASQLVSGNLVQVSGRPVGTVQKIELSRDGQAELVLKIDPEFAPLRQGTRAVVRQASLSGVANRYVDLQMPSGSGGATIPDGGLIDERSTAAAVELDQLFDLFDEDTRDGLRKVIRGSATQYGGRGPEANDGWEFLNPSLVGTQRLFRELNDDPRLLERFVVTSSKLVTDLADRRDDLVGLVDGLADTTSAIGRERANFSEAISRLPPFMRRANTTFVNLRTTLDTLDPFVEESKPVAPKLRAFLKELRPAAIDAVPTIRDLTTLVKRDGKANDLLELSKATLPFRDIAVGPVQRNGAQREGAFPAATKSLRSQTPRFAFQRPYFVDFTGWLDDFSHTGIYDANGSATRSAIQVNAFSNVAGTLQPIPVELRRALLDTVLVNGQTNRCPGSIERPAPDSGNPFKPSPDFNCDETQLPPGP